MDLFRVLLHLFMERHTSYKLEMQVVSAIVYLGNGNINSSWWIPGGGDSPSHLGQLKMEVVVVEDTLVCLRIVIRVFQLNYDAGGGGGSTWAPIIWW